MKKYAVLLLIALSAFACAKNDGTSTGNPLVELRIKSFNSSMAVNGLNLNGAEVSAQSVSDLKFCFKRLRFKQEHESTDSDTSRDSDNLDFELGEVTISALGTQLEGVELPPGNYTRVEFDLEDECPSGKSVTLTNGQGTFSTNDRITITFEGNFTHDSSDDVLELDIQQIVNALDTVNSNDDIKQKTEGISGSF